MGIAIRATKTKTRKGELWMVSLLVSLLVCLLVSLFVQVKTLSTLEVQVKRVKRLQPELASQSGRHNRMETALGHLEG